jgi:hypothetical protein
MSRGTLRLGQHGFLMAAAFLSELCLAGISPLAQTGVHVLRLDQMVPPSAVIGTDGVTLTLAGQGFRVGDELQSGSPSVSVLSFTVVSPTLATATLRILPDAPPGPVRLDIWGFGLTTAKQVPPPPTLLLYPSGGLASPFAVRDAAVVFPSPGKLLAAGDPVFARGLLSTSGTGTVIGTFLLDGIPFDQFTIPVTAGEPAGIQAKVPIPGTYTGTHDLQVQILYPQRYLSGAVKVIATPDSRTALQLVAPADGAVVTAVSNLRWTPVPGAARYEVLWAHGDAAAPTIFPASGDSWMPNTTQSAMIGAGPARWSVRPVFPGDVPGSAAPWRSISVLGSAVELSLAPQSAGPLPGSVRLSWSGGSDGLLYLLEFTSPAENGKRLFRALTKKSEYLLRHFPVSGPMDFRVTPLSPSGRKVGEPAVGRVTPNRSGIDPREPQLQFAAGPASLQGTAPPDGAVVNDARAPIGASWTGTVAPDDVAVFVDDTDVSPMVSLSPGRLDYTPDAPLEEGAHTVKISLGAADFQWGFTVKTASDGSEGGGEASSGTGGENSSPSLGGWTAVAGGTFTGLSGSLPSQMDTFRLTLSSQSDLGTGGWFIRHTVDASFVHEFSDPHLTLNESFNWVIEGGFQGRDWGWDAKVGYASVGFLSESQLVSPGLARGGIEAALTSPAGKLGVYGSFDDTTQGLNSGSGAGEIRVRAIGYSVPFLDHRFALSFLGLWSNQDTTATVNGGAGRVLGILARLDFSPEFRMVLEAAQGRDQPDGGEAYQGNGYRLGFSGIISGTAYTLNLRRIDATFANPANPGYTQEGVPDRMGGDLKLAHTFGNLSTALTFGYVETGVGDAGAGATDGRQVNGTLTLWLKATPTLQLSGMFSGAWASQSANRTDRLPATDQSTYGVSLSAVEKLGDLSFSQTYSGQRTRDDQNPLSDNTASTFSLTLGGRFSRTLGISATGAFTRNWASGAAGRTDYLVLSVAPFWTLPDIHLTVTPRLSYTKNLNGNGTLNNHAEGYQLSVAWNPVWWNSLLSLQGSAEYDRNVDALTPIPIVSSHRYTVSVVFRWGGGKGTIYDRYAQGGGSSALAPVPGPAKGSGT